MQPWGRKGPKSKKFPASTADRSGPDCFEGWGRAWEILLQEALQGGAGCSDLSFPKKQEAESRSRQDPFY